MTGTDASTDASTSQIQLTSTAFTYGETDTLPVYLRGGRYLSLP